MPLLLRPKIFPGGLVIGLGMHELEPVVVLPADTFEPLAGVAMAHGDPLPMLAFGVGMAPGPSSWCVRSPARTPDNPTLLAKELPAEDVVVVAEAEVLMLAEQVALGLEVDVDVLPTPTRRLLLPALASVPASGTDDASELCTITPLVTVVGEATWGLCSITDDGEPGARAGRRARGTGSEGTFRAWQAEPADVERGVVTTSALTSDS
ncbi:hypothetical protein ZHAS_00011358 [Anopheles sinensis]|uniref:Uncharacterized protein n=1 Tax=Anopheles sinensis TaxID=74873 RepID=A0A084W002_ANOSI|nr:hypothetical protein ZHAS_00011358 [Anopheles sinensis]